MRKISVTLNGDVKMLEIPHEKHFEEGFCIDFFISIEKLPEKEFLLLIKEKTEHIDWISFKVSGVFINLDILKKNFVNLFADCDWMTGDLLVLPQYDNAMHTNIPVVSFEMSKEEIMMKSPKKIFLSHKGSNKVFVKRYYDVLKTMGYEPWLDDEDMPAGSNLDRSIFKGFKDSCACIFFITPEFRDEDYLADEIDYAHSENRKKKEKFSIITLQFENEKGETGVIPELLERFVWKNPKHELEALSQILKALPIEANLIDWKKE
ncbi:toll/interleukin-1 receptor domain-containing protein [Sporosarcina psychrophila]|uniref:toll/interleukin-1 receptor domain-containing protein n=1 Tax=Sporosarcina psychrophila TaxID=1476 RepID=UPI00078B4086|nr:toll/interleukin-1 receptor domain-containing protein [Sporosarcina psychrophila]AMQ05222.1 hypothetical protein AZE41_04310 [Sporosarcina psychrophila]